MAYRLQAETFGDLDRKTIRMLERLAAPASILRGTSDSRGRVQEMIDDIELARALHVLFVFHWIGGVAFVTLVALPLARS